MKQGAGKPNNPIIFGIHFFGRAVFISSILLAVFLIFPATVWSQANVESTEATLDNTVKPEDLGAKEASILPDNFLYNFKRFGRGVQEALTFDPAKKADVELRHASQELVDAQKMLEKRGENEEAVEKAGESIERFQRKTEDANEHRDEVKKEATAEGEANLDAFIQSNLDKQIKQQKLLEYLEKVAVQKAPEQKADEFLEKIQAGQKFSAEQMGETIRKISSKEKMKEHFNKVFENQKGSEFKDLRNLEVLKRVEEHVPQEARAAIMQAQENALKRFVSKEKFQDEKWEARFEAYIQNTNGDETRQLEIFNEMKQLDEAPVEVKEKMEQAKDLAMQKFQDRMQEMDGQIKNEKVKEKMRARIFARFEDGTPEIEDLRVMEEIRERATKLDDKTKRQFEEQRNMAVQKFQQSFPDDAGDANRFAELAQKMAENPDPTTFRLIQELETKVKSDPNKRAFLEKMEQEVKGKFLEEAQKDGEQFFAKITSNNPKDIEFFKEFKAEFEQNPESFVRPGAFSGNFTPGRPGEFPPGRPVVLPPQARQFFDRAIEQQSKVIVDNFAGIEDEDQFEQARERLNEIPREALQEIEKHRDDFKKIFEEKQKFIQEKVERLPPSDEDNPNSGRARFKREFQEKIESVTNPEQKEQLWQDWQKQDQNFRRADFEKNVRLNPFCDEACKQKENVRFETNLLQENAQRERLPQGEIFPGLRPEDVTPESAEFIRNQINNERSRPFSQENQPVNEEERRGQENVRGQLENKLRDTNATPEQKEQLRRDFERESQPRFTPSRENREQGNFEEGRRAPPRELGRPIETPREERKEFSQPSPQLEQRVPREPGRSVEIERGREPRPEFEKPQPVNPRESGREPLRESSGEQRGEFKPFEPSRTPEPSREFRPLPQIQPQRDFIPAPQTTPQIERRSEPQIQPAPQIQTAPIVESRPAEPSSPPAPAQTFSPPPSGGDSGGSQSSGGFSAPPPASGGGGAVSGPGPSGSSPSGGEPDR